MGESLKSLLSDYRQFTDYNSTQLASERQSRIVKTDSIERIVTDIPETLTYGLAELKEKYSHVGPANNYEEFKFKLEGIVEAKQIRNNAISKTKEERWNQKNHDSARLTALKDELETIATDNLTVEEQHKVLLDSLSTTERVLSTRKMIPESQRIPKSAINNSESSGDDSIRLHLDLMLKEIEDVEKNLVLN